MQIKLSDNTKYTVKTVSQTYSGIDHTMKLNIVFDGNELDFNSIDTIFSLDNCAVVTIERTDGNIVYNNLVLDYCSNDIYDMSNEIIVMFNFSEQTEE